MAWNSYRPFMLACAVSLVGCGCAGCAKDSSTTDSPSAVANGDEALNGAPTSAEANPAPRMPVEDLELALSKIRAAFFNDVEVYKQIYPPGWHKRRIYPTDIQWTVTEGDPQTPGSKAIVKLTYEPHFSIIHPTKDEAEADDDLVPFAPQPTRQEMMENPLNPRLDPVEITIEYERREDGWVRVGWSSQPENGEREDWLDVLAVP